jgi:pimeloyl-ACP methyl ester carboxylesterase
VIGGGVDFALARTEAATDSESSPRRDALVSALNGVVGDYLAATGNPLAMPMRLHRRDDATPTGRVLVLVHGLCSNHAHWKHRGHCHGEALSHAFTPVYASYNSGRHISLNGRELAAALEELVDTWPVPVTQLVLLGHSMGGLVARSACEYGRRAGHRWLQQLTDLVFLGTPHHGAPLERAGNLASLLLELSPYAAPIGRIGGGRSAGIVDLRFGNVVDEDWQDQPHHHRTDPRKPLPLPPGVRCYAIAATRGRRAGDVRDRLLGDGLVPLASALGQHADSAFALQFPEAHQRVIQECGHLDLLDHAAVVEQLATWLGATSPAS